jgi:hypothetical protein
MRNSRPLAGYIKFDKTHSEIRVFDAHGYDVQEEGRAVYIERVRRAKRALQVGFEDSADIKLPNLLR